jgi:hypothetical protein
MSGLIILPIFIFYVVVGTLVLKFLLKKFKKPLNTAVVILIVIFLPFWDIIGANLIKVYYELTLEPIIYEYPERDANGKIESIGSSLAHGKHMENFTNKDRLDRLLKKLKASKVSDFVEYYSTIYKIIPRDYTEKGEDVLIRVNINNKDKPYEIITKSQARYIGKSLPKPKPTFLLLFAVFKNEYGVFDTKKNKLIGKSQTVSIGTLRFMDTFRRKVFLLPSFRTGFVNTWPKMKKQLFKGIRIIG